MDVLSLNRVDDIMQTMKIFSCMLQGSSSIDFRTDQYDEVPCLENFDKYINPYDPVLSDDEMTSSPTSAKEYFESYFVSLDDEFESYTNSFKYSEDSSSSSFDTEPPSPLPTSLPSLPYSPTIEESLDEEQVLNEVYVPPTTTPKTYTKPVQQKLRKRKRRKNLLKPGSQLYQFVLQLLDDEEKRDYIRWVHQRQGIFRIVKKDEVANMWGRFKQRNMTYDSLSRGLRHYYQQGLLSSVNKKLHYQFTKKALDEWEIIRDQELIDDSR